MRAFRTLQGEVEKVLLRSFNCLMLGAHLSAQQLAVCTVAMCKLMREDR
jgi:hypothetical protein